MAIKKILKYNDGTAIKTPIAEIVQGTNITVTQELDTDGNPTDKVTIAASSAEVEGTANQVKVDIANGVSTVSLEPELVLPGNKVSFTSAISGTIPTLPAYTLFFHTVTV
jgi:hypothetical protein